jgi:hypothetical protein
MRRASNLYRRVQQAEVALAPKRPPLHVRVVIDGMVCTRAPVAGAKWLVVPEIPYMRDSSGRQVPDLDTWEALAASSQDRLVAEARADIKEVRAAASPEGEPPVYLRPRSH